MRGSVQKLNIGTVVELCAKKHKRRRATNRYKGVANLRYQKPWNGFNITSNPDAHWSRSTYNMLDKLQSRSVGAVYFGRDDQSSFRLDTTYTHKQHGAITMQNTVTTRTDFVNKR